MLEIKCECGRKAKMHKYRSDGETWYYYKCEYCGRRNKLDYNYASLAITAWIAGEVIVDKNEFDVKEMLN